MHVYTHTAHTHTLHSKLPAALLRGTEIKWSSGSWGISWLSFLWPPVSNGKQAAGKANIAWLTQPEKRKFVQSHISSQVAEWSRICLPMEKMQVQFLGQEDPPLQNSCLENSTDRRTFQVVTNSWTWLSDWAHTSKTKNRILTNIFKTWIYDFIRSNHFVSLRPWNHNTKLRTPYQDLLPPWLQGQLHSFLCET